MSARQTGLTVVVIACQVWLAHTASAQLLGTTAGTIQYPLSIPAREVKTSLGISFSKIPTDIVEEAASYRWPLFIFDLHYGLPENFLLAGKVNTQIVTNHISVGGKWVYDVTPRFHASIGYDLAYWFGQLKQYGFNNRGHGWINYPNLTLGYDFGSLALTLKSEASYVTSIAASADDIEVSSTMNFFNGVSFTLYLEQPLWKDNNLILGFRMNYLKFFYPEWLLFPTFNKYYYIPDLEVGFRL